MKDIQRIQRFTVSENLPPRGAVAAGVTPDGRQLWKESIPMARAVAKVDENGKREYAKNPLTAEPLYPKNRPEFYTWNRLYYLFDEGNGNVTKVEYIPPSQAQLDAVARETRVKQVMAELAEKLIDKNVDINALLDRIAGTPVTTAEIAAVEEITEIKPKAGEIVIPEPVKVGVALYQLSNGSKCRGKLSDAIEQERRLQEAKATAAALPEV